MVFKVTLVPVDGAKVSESLSKFVLICGGLFNRLLRERFANVMTMYHIEVHFIVREKRRKTK